MPPRVSDPIGLQRGSMSSSKFPGGTGSQGHTLGTSVKYYPERVPYKCRLGGPTSGPLNLDLHVMEIGVVLRQEGLEARF